MMMMARRTMRRMVGATAWPWARATRSLSLSAINDNRIIMSPPLVTLDLPEIWTPPDSHDCNPLPQRNCSNLQTATVIDGKSIAEEIRSGIDKEVRRMKESIRKVPGLAVILVGERRDSQTYVRNKIKACEEVGIKSIVTEFADGCTEDEVLNALSNYNQDSSINGILVQLPLPQHLDEGKILDAVSLEKDVDGFHPLNIGNLAMRGREPLFIPCTPKGCIELLIRSGVEIMGKNAVVIGRSNIVGLPTSLLLQITSEADIVIAAAGVANLVRGSWLKPGAVVLDVGTCPVDDPSCEYRYRLMGDVCYEEAMRLASVITPVPGGVGPITVAMLLSNTLDSAKRAYGFT